VPPTESTALNKQLFSRVATVAGDVFSIPESSLTEISSPDTIETWDSLHHLSLVVALEQEFDIQFSPEEVEQLLSVELIIALVEEKLRGGGASDGG
jgi:acyl carrier protein